MKYDLPAAIRKLTSASDTNATPVDVDLVVSVLQSFFPEMTLAQLADEVIALLGIEGRSFTWSGVAQDGLLG